MPDNLSPSLDNLASQQDGDTNKESMTEFIDRLMGGQPPAARPSPPPAPAGKFYAAPVNPPYPSDEEASQAIQSGFAYGKPWERYFDNSVARILNKPSSPGTLQAYGARPGSLSDWSVKTTTDDDLGKFVRQLSQISSVSDPPTSTKNAFARAALAANRHPISSIGFSPQNTTLDVATKRSTLLGAQLPESMYANAAGPLAKNWHVIVHESTHNGIDRIRKAHPEIPPVDPVMNEMIVRHVMRESMGDPENAAQANRFEPQSLESDKWFAENRGNIRGVYAQLMKAAQDMISKQRGPR